MTTNPTTIDALVQKLTTMCDPEASEALERLYARDGEILAAQYAAQDAHRLWCDLAIKNPEDPKPVQRAKDAFERAVGYARLLSR